MDEFLISLERRITELETRVKKLEKSQLDCMKEVHDYINDSEAIANMQQKEMELLPEKIKTIFNEYAILKEEYFKK